MNKNYLIILLLGNLFSSCKNSEPKVERRIFTKYSIEAKFIDSTIIDGTAKYYDSNNNLTQIINYVRGKKEGYSTIYYPNQNLEDSMFFSNNLKNGFLYKFDSSGILMRKIYYYYGLEVGDQFYRSATNLDIYFFLDFNKNILVRCEYDSSGKTKLDYFEVKPKINTVFKDKDTAFNLLIYFPKPPNLSMTFRLGITNDNHEIKNEVELNSNRLFLDTVVLKPEKGWFPSVSIHVENLKDSINKIYYYDFKYE